MPARSNEFQDLITILERILAPTAAKVYGSKMLKDDRTGGEREVDIIIETMCGPHPVVIGLEVADRNRKSDVPWIEQIAGKHGSLPIDKTIAVSRIGFTEPALKKAQALKIDALTFEQLATVDWNAKIASLPSVEINCFMRPRMSAATVVFNDENSFKKFSNYSEIPNLVVYHPNGAPRGTVISILEKFLTNEAVVKAIEEKAFTDSGTTVEGGIGIQPGSFVKAPDGTRHVLHGIRFEAQCKKEVVSAKLQKGRYRDKAVVFGSGRVFDRDLKMVFLEKPGENVEVHILVPKGPTLK